MREQKVNTNLPIRYYPAIEEGLDGWASECGCSSATLEKLIDFAIRNRQAEATEAGQAISPQRVIYSLDIGLPGEVRVYYTIEEQAIIVRGFSWQIVGDPRDDFDGGGFFVDYEEEAAFAVLGR